MALFGARTEVEALQGGERVGGEGGDSRAAAMTVVPVVVAFARFRARAAGVWSQKY